ncbi:trypsin-like peptidase domain-containing protein [Kribbella sp. NPDC004536]|uniref:trypsin-like peptidase domain-containing protein n=1 Tax=Kribbella sp. NPDC004536 TaxID=3364106 RepID=UPI0036B46506
MEYGRNALPRPPRRVPADAGSLTQLEAPGRPGGPQPPVRGPWIFGRFLAGLIVLLVIVAGGAGAGWYLRQRSVQIDTDAVLKSAGPAVVRVLATTCGGSGEASGVLIDNGRVLTAASAVDQAMAIVVVAPDGRIRRANLLGTSTDGVAVLQSIGFDDPPLKLAAVGPERKAERALIGYTAAGAQVINPIGSEADPRAFSEFMNAAKLGGPVVDKSGELVGLVTGATVQAAAVVPLARLRDYAARTPSGITVAVPGTCPDSHGPQGAVAPELQVAKTPLAQEVQAMLGNYLTLQNRHQFDQVQALYSPQLAKSLTPARDRTSRGTAYFFNPRITALAPDGSYARMSYDVLFSPTANGAGGGTCNRLDNRFELVRVGGKLVINRSVKAADIVACEAG